MDHTYHLAGVLCQRRVPLKQLSSQTQPVTTFNIRPSREWTVLARSVAEAKFCIVLGPLSFLVPVCEQKCTKLPTLSRLQMNLELTFPTFCASARGEGKNQSASILGLEAILQKKKMRFIPLYN